MAAKIWRGHGESNDDDGKYRLCSNIPPKDKKNEEVVQKRAWNRQEIGLEECFLKKNLCSIIPNRREKGSE